jgi:hypothetical protein
VVGHLRRGPPPVLGRRRLRVPARHPLRRRRPPPRAVRPRRAGQDSGSRGRAAGVRRSRESRAGVRRGDRSIAGPPLLELSRPRHFGFTDQGFRERQRVHLLKNQDSTLSLNDLFLVRWAGPCHPAVHIHHQLERRGHQVRSRAVQEGRRDEASTLGTRGSEGQSDARRERHASRVSSGNSYFSQTTSINRLPCLPPERQFTYSHLSLAGHTTESGAQRALCRKGSSTSEGRSRTSWK